LFTPSAANASSAVKHCSALCPIKVWGSLIESLLF
jgi:hypothetical protein